MIVDHLTVQRLERKYEVSHCSMYDILAEAYAAGYAAGEASRPRTSTGELTALHDVCSEMEELRKRLHEQQAAIDSLKRLAPNKPIRTFA